ncbi:hypothetical protein C7M84_009310 [Penaeus vannamei]|uniref:Uncharacterized protein n=1 Tax=Penaeus vannamei TaxID=6689 RepID=A0A3R7MBM3_PENVA|nr:hypothetical protein C7M84_009310 [Penaeus vannamei]
MIAFCLVLSREKSNDVNLPILLFVFRLSLLFVSPSVLSFSLLLRSSFAPSVFFALPFYFVLNPSLFDPSVFLRPSSLLRPSPSLRFLRSPSLFRFFLLFHQFPSLLPVSPSLLPSLSLFRLSFALSVPSLFVLLVFTFLRSFRSLALPSLLVLPRLLGSSVLFVLPSLLRSFPSLPSSSVLLRSFPFSLLLPSRPSLFVIFCAPSVFLLLPSSFAPSRLSFAFRLPSLLPVSPSLLPSVSSSLPVSPRSSVSARSFVSSLLPFRLLLLRLFFAFRLSSLLRLALSRLSLRLRSPSALPVSPSLLPVSLRCLTSFFALPSSSLLLPSLACLRSLRSLRLSSVFHRFLRFPVSPSSSVSFALSVFLLALFPFSCPSVRLPSLLFRLPSSFPFSFRCFRSLLRSFLVSLLLPSSFVVLRLLLAPSVSFAPSRQLFVLPFSSLLPRLSFVSFPLSFAPSVLLRSFRLLFAPSGLSSFFRLSFAPSVLFAPCLLRSVPSSFVLPPWSLVFSSSSLGLFVLPVSPFALLSLFVFPSLLRSSLRSLVLRLPSPPSVLFAPSPSARLPSPLLVPFAPPPPRLSLALRLSFVLRFLRPSVFLRSFPVLLSLLRLLRSLPVLLRSSRLFRSFVFFSLRLFSFAPSRSFFVFWSSFVLPSLLASSVLLIAMLIQTGPDIIEKFPDHKLDIPYAHWLIKPDDGVPTDEEKGTTKCPTLQKCLGYQACLFNFGIEFCHMDPVPGQRKNLGVNLTCVRDEELLRSMLSVNYEAEFVHEVFRRTKLVAPPQTGSIAISPTRAQQTTWPRLTF